MKTKVILCFVFCALCAVTATAQDTRAKINDYLGKEIRLDDGWTGQSMTLLKENDDYIILRKYFGSGRPVLGTLKYKVVFKSDYMIEFGTETIDPPCDDAAKMQETFRLAVEEKGLCLYLNGLKVVIDEHFPGMAE